MGERKLALSALNHAGRDEFVQVLAGVFENAPWVAERACEARPFASLAALHSAMLAAVRAAPPETQVEFLRGHPDLAGKAARAGRMTEHSESEQASAGLDRLSDADYERFERLNHAYRERFGFPFIVCVRNHTRAEILDAYETRLGHDRDLEIRRALEEIAEITRLRLESLVDGGR